MRSSKPWFSLAAIIIQSCLLITSPAQADTYKSSLLDSDQDRFVPMEWMPPASWFSPPTHGSSGQCTIIADCYGNLHRRSPAVRTNGPRWPSRTTRELHAAQPRPLGLTVLHRRL